LQLSGGTAVATIREYVKGLLILLIACAGPSAVQAADVDVITIAGQISRTNRGAFDAFSDRFLKYHEKKFDKAFTFTRTALSNMPQVTITARAEGWPAEVKATGPRLSDVLTAAGVAEDAELVATALDGYASVLSAADRRKANWVLAIEADGRPLSLGGRGPVWLLSDTQGKTVGADIENNWVWSVFLIEAR
jgi:hypothetical protein